jgi:tetratricopeptide (TPR) repeat protein
MTVRSLVSSVLAAGSLCVALLLPGAARADDSAAAMRDAGKHFQRAVSLYGEADYRAALVEFKRAYAGSPHVSVLYNIGETQYQLQDYAAALTTFEHFLADSPPTDPHRGEVESDVEVLRARVGHLTVVTIPPGADLTIDDQAAGHTPLDRAMLVSIGHRKIVASLAGRPPVTKYVDVATDDNLSITLQLQDTSAPAAPRPVLPLLARAPVEETPPSHAGSTWRIVGWTTTGLLTAGAVTMGLLADKASNDLSTARSSYPVSAGTLNHDASLTSTYSAIADSLAVAALVVGGITLTSTVVAASSSDHGTERAARLELGPTSARLDVTF